MRYIEQVIDEGLPALDNAFSISNDKLPKYLKIDYLVKFSTRILVEFLRIHPYANGNGHLGRFIVIALLARYNLWPKKWPLDASPNYHDEIFRYRNGDREPLERFILKALLG